MIELYAKIVDNQITEVSSGIGTTGTWVTVDGYEGEDQKLYYDVISNTVKCKDEIAVSYTHLTLPTSDLV